MPATDRPTSKDVAHAAGVSQSTVSIVLTGKWPGRISPPTAEAVLAAAERLGYRPNIAARNLRLGRTRTVLLVVPTLMNPFFSSIYTGAARTAAGHGFGIVVYPLPVTEASPFAVAQEAIDGVLASSMASDAVTRLCQGPAELPLVMLDSDPSGGTPAVNLDVAGGMRAIVAHLDKLGHRAFGHVAADVPEWTFRARSQGLSGAVGALPGARLTRARTAINVAAARQAALGLLSEPDRPTALVCDDDVIAAGAYKAARDAGLDIPGDVSITGFDDLLLAEALHPELTTVRLPAEELGAESMAVLLDLLGGREPRELSLTGELIIRSSTGPV